MTCEAMLASAASSGRNQTLIVSDTGRRAGPSKAPDVTALHTPQHMRHAFHASSPTPFPHIPTTSTIQFTPSHKVAAVILTRSEHVCIPISSASRSRLHLVCIPITSASRLHVVCISSASRSRLQVFAIRRVLIRVSLVLQPSHLGLLWRGLHQGHRGRPEGHERQLELGPVSLWPTRPKT